MLGRHYKGIWRGLGGRKGSLLVGMKGILKIGRINGWRDGMSAIEEELLFQIRALKLPEPEREHRFHPVRRWRFDFAWPDLMLACEVEGGTWANGRHSRGSGFEKDCEKYGEAMLLGWDVYRCTSGMVKSGAAIDTIHKLMEALND